MIQVQCCVCYAIKQPDGTFKKIEGVNSNLPLTSHTYCETCGKAALENMRPHKRVTLSNMGGRSWT